MTKFDGYELYGGASITRAIDASGAVWIGCTARRNADQRFGFYLFKNGVEVAYAPFCTGRGSINEQGWWIATSDNKEYATGPIPGFVPLPRAVVPQIPPDSPISVLFQGIYKATDLDTPAELALRFNKKLAAFNQLIELLIAAGVVRR